MKRTEIRKKRLQLSKEQTFLEQKHCAGCCRGGEPPTSIRNFFCNSYCKIGTELKNIGDQLNEISKSRRPNTKKEITKERYQELVEKGYTLNHICSILKISKAHLFNHRKKWGLVKSEGRRRSSGG
jgi:hypothetical protein